MDSVRSPCKLSSYISDDGKRSGDLQLLLQNYVGNFSDSIEQAYKNGLQQTDEDDWVNVTNSGIGFNQLPHEADLASNLRDNLTALFYMKAMK